jgi:hypothetical protein
MAGVGGGVAVPCLCRAWATWSTSGEQGLNALRAVVEYASEIPSHLKPMDQPAQGAERKRVLDVIHDASAAFDFRESMRVAPKPIRSLRLHINELVGWIPPLDFRDPAQRNPVDAQGVSNGGAFPHRDWRWSENPETHPRRSDSFEVLRAREELEDRRTRSGNPQFTMQRIVGHHRTFIPRQEVSILPTKAPGKALGRNRPRIARRLCRFDRSISGKRLGGPGMPCAASTDPCRHKT